MKMYGLVVTVLFTLLGQVSAQETSAGISGGNVGQVVFDVNTPNQGFAAVNGAGVYRTNDGGQTWALKPIPTPDFYSSRQIAVSSFTANLVLSCLAGGSNNNLFRSVDAGNSWAPVDPSIPNASATPICSSIYESKQPGVFYVAMLSVYTNSSPLGQLYRSADSGQTWQLVFSSASTVVAHVDQLSSGEVFFGTRDCQPMDSLCQTFTNTGSLYWSADGATNWAGVSLPSNFSHASSIFGLADADNIGLGVVVNDNTANNRGDLYYSVLSTQTFTFSTPTTISGSSYYDPATSNTALKSFLTSQGYASALSHDPINGNFYLNTGMIVLQSNSLNGPFTDITGDLVSSGYGICSITSVAGSNSTTSPSLVMASMLATTLPSTIALNQYGNNSNLSAVAQIADVEGKGSTEGLYGTTDGSNWNIANTGLGAAWEDGAIEDHNTGYYFSYSKSPAHVWFSSSGFSAAWRTVFRGSLQDSSVGAGLGIQAFALDRSNPTHAVINMNTPLSNGDGNGNNLMLNNANVLAAPDDVSQYTTVTGPNFWNSVNGSNSVPNASHSGWTTVTDYYPGQGSISSAAPIRALLVDGTTIYAGLAPHADATPATGSCSAQGTILPSNYLFKSVDGGNTWTALSLVSVGVRSLSFDPFNPHVVYVGTGDGRSVDSHCIDQSDYYADEGNGIWQSQDDGNSWSFMGISTGAVLEIAVDTTTQGRLWVLSQTVSNPSPTDPSSASQVWETDNGGTSWAQIAGANEAPTSVAYSASENMVILGNRDHGYVLGTTPGNNTWQSVYATFGGINALFNGSVGVVTSNGVKKAGIVALVNIPRAKTFKGTTLGVSSITWSWGMYPGSSNNYDLFYGTASKIVIGKRDLIPAATLAQNLFDTYDFMETSLQPDTCYKRGLGWATKNGITKVEETACTLAVAPTGITFSSVTKNTMVVNWPRQVATTFKVRYYGIVNNKLVGNVRIETVSGKDIFVKLGGLTSNASYYVALEAVNQEGLASPSDWSVAGSTLTLPAPVRARVETIQVTRARRSIQVRGALFTMDDIPEGATISVLGKGGTLMRNLTITGDSTTWDGTDQYGTAVRPGVYYLLFEDGSDKKFVRILLTK